MTDFTLIGHQSRDFLSKYLVSNFSHAILIRMGAYDLEKEVIDLRVQNRYAAVRLQTIYSEMDHFMRKYYDKVGDLCLKIHEFEAKQKKYQIKIQADISADTPENNYIAGFNEIRPRKDISEESIEKEAKALHRKLIKTIHPDVSEEKLKAAEYTRMVNEAYNQRNLTELVKLDQLRNSGQATERDLVKQRNNLIDATFDLKIQREQLADNPIYKLMQKFKSQDDEGKTMLEQIRKSLEARVKEEKGKLLNLKLEYLEKMKDKITA